MPMAFFRKDKINLLIRKPTVTETITFQLFFLSLSLVLTGK